MTKIIILILCMYVPSFNTYADSDAYYRIAANALIVTDWLQTREISNNIDYYERNRILGKYPSTNRVDKYFVGSLVVVNVIGENLDQEDQKFWYGGIAVLRLITVIKNKQIGITINF